MAAAAPARATPSGSSAPILPGDAAEPHRLAAERQVRPALHPRDGMGGGADRRALVARCLAGRWNGHLRRRSPSKPDARRPAAAGAGLAAAARRRAGAADRRRRRGLRRAAGADLAGRDHDCAPGRRAQPEDPTRLPRHARAVLFGDFLAPAAGDPCRRRGLAARPVRGHILQVLDPAEETPALCRAHPLRRGRTARRHLSWCRGSRRSAPVYAERLRHHREGIAAIAAAAGWGFVDAPHRPAARGGPAGAVAGAGADNRRRPHGHPLHAQGNRLSVAVAAARPSPRGRPGRGAGAEPGRPMSRLRPGDPPGRSAIVTASQC